MDRRKFLTALLAFVPWLRGERRATSELPSRYLLKVDHFRVDNEGRARLHGLRQEVTIGLSQKREEQFLLHFPTATYGRTGGELRVTEAQSPRWHFADGVVSWKFLPAHRNRI